MTAIIKPFRFSGNVKAPASKSHTIRRLFMAALTDGVSEIENPLDSLDTRSCLSVCRVLGAEIAEIFEEDDHAKTQRRKVWRVTGKSPEFLRAFAKICDAGNSGTTLFLGLAAASLGSESVEFDGDNSLKSRSAGHLLDALAGLGVSVKSAPNGCIPITVCGPWKGGRVSISCPTSQYLSALLLAAPLAPAGVITEIDVPLLNERPYIEMTLSYLESQDIKYEASADFSYFRISGGNEYKPISGPVPADFSSAAFPAAAAAISGGSVTLLGLDPDDLQGDKAFFCFLEKMGCRIQWEQVPLQRGISFEPLIPAELMAIGVQAPELFFAEWQLNVSRSGPLRGGEFDLNDTPDLFPALAAVAAFAKGETILYNAAHARIKETDRISVMAAELKKLGVKTAERPDGLVIYGNGGLTPNASGGFIKLNGHGDHRIVMALAAAALGCGAPVEIEGAEAAAVSWPGFLELLNCTTA